MIPSRINRVEALDEFCLKIFYINGEEKIYDMKKFLNYNLNKKLNNIEYFKMAKSAKTTVEWPEGKNVNKNRCEW